VSKDGSTFTKLADYSAKKGDATISASTTDYSQGPVWVRITNKATGSLHVTGVKIMYTGYASEDDVDDPIDDTTNDATAEFTLNDNALTFINGTATETIDYDDPVTIFTVNVTPNVEGATVSSVTGATEQSGVYTFSAPEAGSSVSVVFVITAPDGITTKTYTINVVREADPGSIEIETGLVTLQSDHVPEGYKVDGSASVTAYTYSSDLCSNASLFTVLAGQHTVTLPANAKITKIVMYAVGDNNTDNKGKITELAGQTFDVYLPSRKTGTALAEAVVDGVSITGQFTFTVTYKAGVKFLLTVEQITTGISHAQSDENSTNVVFDLMGRRVGQTQPDRMYIRDGKKFIAR
jgi:hypothetical protein